MSVQLSCQLWIGFSWSNRYFFKNKHVPLTELLNLPLEWHSLGLYVNPKHVPVYAILASCHGTWRWSTLQKLCMPLYIWFCGGLVIGKLKGLACLSNSMKFPASLEISIRFIHALLCFVFIWYTVFYPYPSGLLHCHQVNQMTAPWPVK